MKKEHNIENFIAEYVEGTCDDVIRQEIDEKRKQEPEFNMLIRAHEKLLTVLTSTPKTPAPIGLGEKILSAVHERERRIAEEQTRYRRDRAMLLPIGFLIAVAGYLAYHFLMVRIHIDMYTALQRLHDLNGIHSVSVQILYWFDIIVSLLKHPVSLPVFLISVPLYYLIALGVLMSTVWYLADDMQFKY